MEHVRLRCQNCHATFSKVFKFKKHLQSHGKKIKEMFPNDTLEPTGYFPYIFFLNSRFDKSSVVGLSHLTLVYGGDSASCFYLCHVCHLKCPLDFIVNHLNSWDHFTNFLSITDPNSLVFSWIPKKEKTSPRFCVEYMRRNGDLQILQLPTKLLSELKSSLYSDVMHTLSHNEQLFRHLQDSLPETDLVQIYQKDSKRESPLLGLHHIVECVCVGPSKERCYLCTLCHLTVAAHMIIKHVLSFDHVFRYFEEWHPSTLLSKASYVINASFTSMISDLAKQAEEIQGCTHMQHVTLEPDEFKSVNFKSYSQALEKLEVIKKCSLQISSKPGRKLVHRPLSVKQLTSVPSTAPPASTPKVPAKQSTQTVFFSSIFKICCQVCNMCGPSMVWFLKHLSHTNHRRSLVQVFDNGAKVASHRLPASFNLGIYSYIQECLRTNKPLVGIPMIVSCISTETETEPVYLCFACLDVFSDSFIEQHLTSEKHVMLTLYQYQDPEVLPFAWKSNVDLNMSVLKAKLWEKEKTGRSSISVKVVDLPHWIFCDIKTKSYSEVVAVLEGHHASLTDGVPLLDRDYNLQAKNNFPLLGKQFLVMYEALNSDLQQYTAFLCLLCQRKLCIEESYAHIFCQEHVATFLDKFHPGSLNSSNVNAKCLLDLAQQAQTRHKTETIQVVNLTQPLWDTYPFKKTTSILKDLREMFEPKIQPKGRLVLSVTPSTLREDHVRGHSVKKNQSVENKGTKNISSEQKLSLDKEVFETVLEVKKQSEEESQKMTKEETKESEVKKTRKEDPRSSPGTVKEDVAILYKQEEAENIEIIPTQLETCGDKSRRNKRSISMCGGSQDETTSGEDMRDKRRRITSEGESGLENESTDVLEMSHKSHQDERLRTVYDCRCGKHDSVYLCMWCSMKIPHEELFSHVTGSGHPKVNLKHVNLEEDVYGFILKQSVDSVIQMVSVLLAQCDSAPECPSTPTFAPSTLKQEQIQITIDDQHIVDSVRYHIKVEHSKTEDDSETSDAAASIPAMTSDTTQAPELIEDTKSHVGNFELASTAEENLVPPDLSEADSSLNSDLESLRTETTLKVDKRMTFGIICSTTSSPCAASKDKVMGITSASSAAASWSLDLVPTSALSLKTETASDALQNAEAMSPKGSTEVHKAPSIMAENAPKYLEPAPADSGICQKLPKSVATAKKSTPAVKKGTQVEEKVDVSPYIHETTQSAAPQVIAALPARPKELPLATANNTKPESVKIGADQIIILKCANENRQQVFCQLCSVKLQASVHLREMNHQYNYVQMKIPGWTAKPWEDSKKFQEAVNMLAKEHGGSAQELEVKVDAYEEVNCLPMKIALQRVKEMLKEKRLKESSSSTANNVAALQKKVAIGSPCEVTSSDDGVNMKKKLPQVGYPESTSTFSKTLAASKETPVSSQQEPRKAPQLQDTRKTPGDAQKTSQVKFLGQNPRVEPAAGDEVQSRSTLSCKEAQTAKHHTRPGRKSSSEERSTISKGVNVENNHGCIKPQVCYPKSTFSKTPATSKETPVSSQQGPRKVPLLQDTRKTPGDAQKTSDVTLSQDPRVEPADLNKEVRSQSRLCYKEDQAAKHDARPGRKSSSEELSTTSIGVNLEKNHGCVKPRVSHPESTSTFPKTPAAAKETPVSSQQRLMKIPELQDTKKTPEDAQSTSDVTLSRDPRAEPAAGDKEVQSQPRLSYKKARAAKHHTRPGRKSSSEELSTISIGVNVENKRGCVTPQVSRPESTFSKPPATPKETPVSRQQSPMKIPELQDTRKTPGDAQKTSDVTFLGRDPRVKPAAGDKELQSQSRSSHQKDQAAKNQQIPGRKSSSEELPTISLGVDVGNNRRSVKPQVGHPESPFSKTPATSKDTPVSSQQEPRKVPQLQDTPKTTGGARETAEVKFLGRGPRVEHAGSNEVQSRSRSSCKVDQTAKHRTRPGRKSSSEERSTISIGQRIYGTSHLSTYLSLKKLEPIIGLGTVWECRGTSQTPFFLCESCEIMLRQNICQHMISQDHKFNYLQKHHTELVDFWTDQDLTEELKQEILDFATSEVAKRERLQEIDAKIVLLGADLYEHLQKNASFSDALKLVQNINDGELRGIWPPVCPPSQKSQQLESQQSLKSAPPTKTQSRPEPEQDQSEFKQKHLNETTMDGELHGIHKRKASSPLDTRSLHSMPDSVSAPLPRDGACIYPKKMCTSLTVQKKVVPPISQPQTETVPVLAANQMDEDSKSPSSRPGDPEVAQTLPLPDPPSKKWPADPSVETLSGLPPKATAPPLQPIQEPSSVSASSNAVDPAATAIPLSPEPENTKSISDQQNIPPAYFTLLSQIISAMRVGTKTVLSAPDTAKAVPSTPSDEAKASVASGRIERNTSDGDLKISVEFPQNWLVAHSDGSTSAVVKSPFEYSCLSNDPTLIPGGGAASGVIMTTTPTASLAESNDPQHPQGSTGQLTCSTVATSVKKPETTDACPINTIVTSRGKYAYGCVLTGGSKGPDPTEVSSDPQAGLSTGLTAPAPAAYAKYSEATDGKGGHSVYKTPVSPTFTTPANLVVNPLAATVNSSVKPQASVVIENSVNTSFQSNANSVVNSAVDPHAVGHSHVVSATNTVEASVIYPPDSSQSSCHSAMGFYPSHIPSGINYAHLQTIGHSSAVGMEPMWTNVEMQQYQYQQQYQYYQLQQHHQQHQYYQQQQHYQLQQYLLQQQHSNKQQNQQQGWYQQSH